MPLVALNEKGLRVGETHVNAKLTDAQVEQIREANTQGVSYRLLADRFGHSKSAIAKICRYERRNQIPVNWKKK
jgi:DNA invertase Pin-like site-specific DNA recombinase